MDTLADSTATLLCGAAANEVDPIRRTTGRQQFARIAILTASPSLQAQMEAYARGSGAEIRSFHEHRELGRSVERGAVDIVILDEANLDLPAHELVCGLRHNSSVGIIVMSAQPDTADRVLALEFGADDFITFPADNREVHARIRALARRMHRTVAKPALGYQFDGWRLDLLSRRLVDTNGRVVRLTAREFEVLCLLLQNSNRPVARERIHASQSDQLDSRAADALVGRLKRKLVAVGGRADLIRSVRSVGYVLVANVKELDPGSDNARATA